MRKVFRTYSDDYPRVVSGGSADMPFLLHKLNPQRISGQVRIAQTNVPYTMDWDLSSGRMKKNPTTEVVGSRPARTLFGSTRRVVGQIATECSGQVNR